MRIIVLGASGGCGQWAVRLAAERGHAVTAVIRATSSYRPPDGVDLRVGEVTDAAFLGDLGIEDAVVLSCLGLRRASPAPWSPLRSPADLVARVTGDLADAGGSAARVVWVSAAGVGDTIDRLSAPVRALVRAANVGVAYRDLARAESIARSAAGSWIAVRPVTLRPGISRRGARWLARYSLWSTVRRGDVASWMLDLAEGRIELDAARPFVGSA